MDVLLIFGIEQNHVRLWLYVLGSFHSGSRNFLYLKRPNQYLPQ
jgi:hypothetical protein